MKKIIIVLILIVFVASIVVVNFFGLEIKQFDGVTYVEMITCDTITIRNEESTTVYPTDFEGTPLFTFDFIPPSGGGSYSTDDESVVSNPNAVTFDYEIFPHLADERGVRFIYDEDAYEDKVVLHESSRTFIFLVPDQIYTFTIEAVDGSGTSITISVYPYFSD